MSHPHIDQLWSSLWTSRFGVNDVRLRFELGGEEFDNTTQQIPRFLQAHHRASVVANTLFRENCVAVVAWNGWNGRRPKLLGLPKVKDGFEALRSTGFEAPQISEWHADLYPDDDDFKTGFSTIRAYEIANNKVARDTILWHSIAAEMPIYPSARVMAFLINPVTSIMLHAYDDRGMDIMADDPAKLRELHSIFADWLLDYDRERMKQLF